LSRTRGFLLLSMLVGILLFGVVGYRIVEGWGFLDSLYQTVITVSTVGFKEVHPLSDAGKVFTIFLVVLGIGFFTYAASQFVKLVVDGRIAELLGKRRMEKALKNIRDHCIVCGYGRMGTVVAENLRSARQALVIVDINPERVRAALEEGFLAVEGDATQESVLLRAGVGHARSVAAILPDDPDNLYLTITAKALNPKIRVVAKAMTTEGKVRLEKVGADMVIAIYSIGGERMSAALVWPEVVDFMDIAYGKGGNVRVEEIRLPPNCRLAGKTIGEAGLRERYGISVLVIRRDQEIITPNPSETLLVGDTVLLMGRSDRLQRFLEEMVESA